MADNRFPGLCGDCVHGHHHSRGSRFVRRRFGPADPRCTPTFDGRAGERRRRDGGRAGDPGGAVTAWTRACVDVHEVPECRAETRTLVQLGEHLGVLQVLTQVRLGVDRPRRTRRLAGDQRADVDDPLALLARDPCPVIGIGGVGQVLVLGELVDDRVEQVLDPQTALTRSRAPP